MVIKKLPVTRSTGSSPLSFIFIVLALVSLSFCSTFLDGTKFSLFIAGNSFFTLFNLPFKLPLIKWISLNKTERLSKLRLIKSVIAEPEIFNGFEANSFTPFTKTWVIFNIFLVAFSVAFLVAALPTALTIPLTLFCVFAILDAAFIPLEATLPAAKASPIPGTEHTAETAACV